jgi:hypothetical protein
LLKATTVVAPIVYFVLYVAEVVLIPMLYKPLNAPPPLKCIINVPTGIDALEIFVTTFAVFEANTAKSVNKKTVYPI